MYFEHFLFTVMKQVKGDNTDSLHAQINLRFQAVLTDAHNSYISMQL